MQRQKTLCPKMVRYVLSTSLIRVRSGRATYKINADNQLRLASAIAFHLGGRPAVRSHGVGGLLLRGGSGLRVGGWRITGRTARATGRLRGRLQMHRGRVARDGSARVDGRRTADHLGGGSACRILG